MTQYEKEIKIRTKEFAIEIIKFVNHLKNQKVDYSLRDQILRSGTSIGANVKEGSASSSKKEFIRFYEIALRSSKETEYWLELINDVYHFEEQTIKINQELIEIIKVIASIIIKLKSTL
jgi:four helix bundle protein